MLPFSILDLLSIKWLRVQCSKQRNCKPKLNVGGSPGKSAYSIGFDRPPILFLHSCVSFSITMSVTGANWDVCVGRWLTTQTWGSLQTFLGSQSSCYWLPTTMWWRNPSLIPTERFEVLSPMRRRKGDGGLSEGHQEDSHFSCSRQGMRLVHQQRTPGPASAYWVWNFLSELEVTASYWRSESCRLLTSI